MPLVDGGVVLKAGVGAVPGGFAKVVPQVAGRELLDDFLAGSGGEFPVGVLLDRAEECVAYADGVVGVLPRDGHIGFGFVAHVERWEFDAGVALLGELDGALDVVGWDFVQLGGGDGVPQRFIGSGVGVDGAVDIARLHDGVDVALVELGTGDETRNLLLFLDLPIDEGFDIWMVDIQADHLGGATGGAAGFDGTG